MRCGPNTWINNHFETGVKKYQLWKNEKRYIVNTILCVAAAKVTFVTGTELVPELALNVFVMTSSHLDYFG